MSQRYKKNRKLVHQIVKIWFHPIKNLDFNIYLLLFASLFLYSAGEQPYVATNTRRKVESELKPERSDISSNVAGEDTSNCSACLMR